MTLENYASACLRNAGMMENLTIYDNNTHSNINQSNPTNGSLPFIHPLPKKKSILQIIESSTCPENCSGYGVCEHGKHRRKNTLYVKQTVVLLSIQLLLLSYLRIDETR